MLVLAAAGGCSAASAPLVIISHFVDEEFFTKTKEKKRISTMKSDQTSPKAAQHNSQGMSNQQHTKKLG